MIDALKKAVYTGMGLAYLTREKLEEAARKLAERLSKASGK